MKKLLVVLATLAVLAVAVPALAGRGHSLTLVPTVTEDQVSFVVEGKVKPKDEGHLWVALVCYDIYAVPVTREDQGEPFGPFTLTTDTCVGFLYVFGSGEILASVVV
jgi:hypothetical protein